MPHSHSVPAPAHSHDFLGASHDENARRTLWVVLLTAAAVFGRAGLGSLIVLGATGVVADRLSRTVVTPGRFSRGPPLRWQRLLTGVGAC